MHASYAIVLAAAACVSAQINIGFNPVQNNEQTNNINVGAPVAPVVPTTSSDITTAPGPATTVVPPPTNTTEPIVYGHPAEETVDCVITHYNPVVATSICPETSSYCEVCDSGDVYTTTYETAYKAFCPTGYTSQTYTITETCSGAYTAPTGYPSGFVETVSTCNTCGTAPITATLTCPGTITTGPPAYTTPTAPVVVEQCPTCTDVAVVSGTGAIYGVKTFTGAASSFSASSACVASFLAVLAGMLLL